LSLEYKPSNEKVIYLISCLGVTISDNYVFYSYNAQIYFDNRPSTIVTGISLIRRATRNF